MSTCHRCGNDKNADREIVLRVWRLAKWRLLCNGPTLITYSNGNTITLSSESEVLAVAWHDGIADRFDAGYARSPAFIERYELWTGLIDAYVDPGSAVLDAGCGSGVFSFAAASRGAVVTAIDGSAAMIVICRKEQIARAVENIHFSEAMLDDLAGQTDGCYDVILSSSVLEYVPQFESVLADFYRLLRPGGKLIVSMPNRRSVYRMLERMAFKVTGKPRYYAHVANVVSSASLDADIRRAGLMPIETTFCAEPPGPFAVLGRLLTAERGKSLVVIVAEKQG